MRGWVIRHGEKGDSGGGLCFSGFLAEPLEDREMRIRSPPDAMSEEGLGEGRAVVGDGRRGLVSGGQGLGGAAGRRFAASQTRMEMGGGMLSKVLGRLPY